MRFLPPDEQSLVCRAQAMGLEGASPAPAFLCPQWCTALSLTLAVPTFGYSLLFVPLLWVIQHDRTATRLARLRLQLDGASAMDIPSQESCLPHEKRFTPMGKEPKNAPG